jgi:hypothetical protein
MATNVNVYEDNTIRGLLWVYLAQTDDEQERLTTRHKNGVGFSGVDGRILTSIATYIINHARISQKQYAIVGRKMEKYHKQLALMPATFDHRTMIDPIPDNEVVFNGPAFLD